MESTKAIYVFGGTPIRLSSSDAWECGLAWWLSLADAGFKLKMEKGKRKGSLLETTKHAKKRAIPSCRCGEEVLVVGVLLG